MADHVFRQSDLERSAWLILANHQAKERLNLPMLKQPSMDHFQRAIGIGTSFVYG